MNLREQRDVLDAILAISEERDAAYAVREANPERWRKAKQDFADTRRFWREVAAYSRAVAIEEELAEAKQSEADVTVNPDAVDTPGAAIAPQED